MATMALAGFAAPATGATSDSAAVVAVVHQFVDGFNKGSVATELATCTPTAAIIDDFAPYVWRSCADWAQAYDAWATQNNVTKGTVTLGKPREAYVTGNVAYVVNPADYAYTQRGKTVSMPGCTWTVVLKKSAGRWRISGWTWADR